MLIPGENALIFLPHGYGCSVIVGRVDAEYPAGWKVIPARTVESCGGDANWVPLANGNKQVRKAAAYGEPMANGINVPLGVFSLPWAGDLPE